jgi:hypothetical protein
MSLVMSDSLPTQFRGYTEINRTIKERIAVENGFELGHYLGENSAEPSASGILSLLGTYVGSDSDAEFRNGAPNSLNSILWYVALSALSQDIARLATATASPGAEPAPREVAGTSPSRPSLPSPSLPTGPAQLALQPSLLQLLAPIRSWPQSSARSDAVLLPYWRALLQYDAPDEEYASWKTFVQTSPQIARLPAGAFMSAITLAALYNPYFLLRS